MSSYTRLDFSGWKLRRSGEATRLFAMSIFFQGRLIIVENSFIGFFEFSAQPLTRQSLKTFVVLGLAVLAHEVVVRATMCDPLSFFTWILQGSHFKRETRARSPLFRVLEIMSSD